MEQTYFHQGAIPATVIAELITTYSSNVQIGAYSMFTGQIRADVQNGKTVTAMEYTTYKEMAAPLLEELVADVTKKYGLQGLTVKHSLGMVQVGETCLCVVAASGHRKEAMQACNEFVERLKKDIPIWGKELLGIEDYQWKVNQ
ncbi:molybdopterin synthase catalytic subunit [Chitinophaga skermanii]|uniref:Molybdopterin synthase catalytic subunit n=1 Tax=Chitinophaga skermanii TaxID=331697 RepID=A0A327Q060_9BACT|nr:molybdenum cofactor biosynthesis protein MoaE [Chitinophaga skermanii]RAI97835.1 molybdopterin synthase catalytic subunit [Chitinophaga skermanii]